MFTSGINQLYRDRGKTFRRSGGPEDVQLCISAARAYVGAAVFCAVFCMIYERFGFGEHSDAMRMMFLFPLIGGALPFALLGTNSRTEIVRSAWFLWHAGVAVLTTGRLLCGIVEVSGRTFDYEPGYWIAGGLMLVWAVVWQIRGLWKMRV